MEVKNRAPSRRSEELEEKVESYIQNKPETKQTISTLEIYNQLEVTQRRAGDTLAQMSQIDGGIIGPRMDDNRQTRYEINHETNRDQ